MVNLEELRHGMKIKIVDSVPYIPGYDNPWLGRIVTVDALGMLPSVGEAAVTIMEDAESVHRIALLQAAIECVIEDCDDPDDEDVEIDERDFERVLKVGLVSG